MRGNVSKGLDGEFKIGLRYWPPDLKSGETIAAVETSVSPSGLTLDGSPTIDGDVVYQKITGGEADKEYTVQFKVTTSRPAIFSNPEIDAITVRMV